VGAWERERVRRIEPLQGNTNPFVKRGGVMMGGRVFGRLRLAMAAVTGIATPARAQGQRFGPICVPSEGANRAPGIAMWRRMKPWSMRNGSHQRRSDACASSTCLCTLATHEPIFHLRSILRPFHRHYVEPPF
jgi:hypothetical protein